MLLKETCLLKGTLCFSPFTSEDFRTRICVEYRLILSRRGSKIEQDNYFIIQHIDNKEQSYYRKAVDDLCLPFLSPTHEITHIEGYLLTTVDEHESTLTIFAQCSRTIYIKTNFGQYLYFIIRCKQSFID